MYQVPFGQSYWDCLPDLIQSHIRDISAKSLHKERMKEVCKSIIAYEEWRFVWKPTFLSPFVNSVTTLSGRKSVKSQFCNKCFKISPEIVFQGTDAHQMY